MGFLNRLTTEPRSPDAGRVPATLATLAGVTVTPDTAVTVPVVWACLRYLSQTCAVLPWHVMAYMAGKGAVIQERHPVDRLIAKRPSPEWSSFQFRETLCHWALRWGNGYAEIEPDQIGRPYALWPVHPERVTVCRATEAERDAYGNEIAGGALYYQIANGSGGQTVLAAGAMFHLRGFGEGPVGVNVIHYAAQSIGWARALQLFGASFFGNGTNIAGVVINKKPLKPDGLARQKAEFNQLYKGPRNANKTAFLDNDAEWKPIGTDPQKAQLIEANMFLVEEICRWFGVPPHKVMHLLRSTFNNIEHQAIEVVVDSVSPWVKRFEDEADFKLFGQNRQGLYTKMNMRALLRGDFKSQNEGLQIARQNGVINADEWRDYLDMNRMKPGAGGDKYIMQSQYTTLERVGEEVAPPDPPPADGLPPEDPATAAARAAFSRILEPVNG